MRGAWAAAVLAAGAAALAQDVEIVSEGSARAAIVAGAEVMAADLSAETAAGVEREEARRRLRESVNDLARCLRAISGATIEVRTAPLPEGDARIPILVGEPARARFGGPARTAPFAQAFRVVVAPDAVGLAGESDLATSYAIYEVLDRLGCRWYLPSDLGEVLPSSATIALPPGDESLAPGTLYRGVWYADDAFRRRNRLGGLYLAAGHALELGYVSREAMEAHPEWQGLVDGKRTPHRFCWASDEAADAVAAGIVASLAATPQGTVSLSPDDGASFCECERCRALDAGDLDPTMGTTSITDRYVRFCNRIAARVTETHPDVLLGFLAYVQYTRPPVRERLHPNLVPMIAPITYCRAHTMRQGAPCPSRALLEPIVRGWGEASRHVSYYNYMFHLAEVTAPYPMMRQMSDELPVLYANGVDLWQPETIPNFESVLPGMVLSLRMAWDPALAPAEVLDEFFVRYYGAAAAAMRRYWQLVDDAWTNVPEHAGCGFGYAVRFPPAFLKEARAAMNAAVKACRTGVERRRVRLHDDALRQFELFMKMRRDLFEGRFRTLRRDAAAWVAAQRTLADRHAPQFAFGKVPWAEDSVGTRYFQTFYEPAYLDAARIAEAATWRSAPLGPWRYAVDETRRAEPLGWTKAGFDDGSWKTTDPATETWSSLGLDTWYGPVVYRATVEIPEAAAGTRTRLWIASTDGEAKVFVNGRHVRYRDEKGRATPAASGYCQPATFDVTAAVKPGPNRIAIVGTRTTLNELGTGGLIGPVYVYQEAP